MTAQEIVNFYMVVRYGKRVEKHAIPVVEAIMRRKEAGQPFTVKEIGMELMGDKYNEKGAHSHLRCGKAQSMTGYITAALQKLKELNLIESYEVKDLEHPRTFTENDACVYYLNGKKLPEKIELSMDDGTKIALPSRWIAGVECKWEPMTYTVYPKIKYYKFK